MNDSIIAFRAKEQLGKFLGKVFAHFSKPKKKFLADMLYGIQASGDTRLSSVMRAINDAPDMRHAVEKRLSRNVANEDIGDEIDKAILAEGARHVRDDSLILVDPTEIRKEFGLRMEHVTMVRDASRSSKEGREVLVHGYHGCMAVACQNGRRKTVPLALKLWSSRAPGHLGENDEVLKLIAAIMAATGGKGTLVYDRGGDRPAFYKAFIENGWDFIVRMTGRNVLSWNGLHEIHWLGRHVKREVLAEHLKSLSQRLGKVPEFANYAIADGLRRAFTRFGRWCRKIIDPEPEPNENDLLEFLPGFRDLFAADTC